MSNSPWSATTWMPGSSRGGETELGRHYDAISAEGCRWQVARRPVSSFNGTPIRCIAGAQPAACPERTGLGAATGQAFAIRTFPERIDPTRKGSTAWAFTLNAAWVGHRRRALLCHHQVAGGPEQRAQRESSVKRRYQ